MLFSRIQSLPEYLRTFPPKYLTQCRATHQFFDPQIENFSISLLPVKPFRFYYSLRNASAGFNRVARQAGNSPANVEIKIAKKAKVRNVFKLSVDSQG